MQKKIVLGMLLLGFLAVAKVVGSKMQNLDWEQRLARMPDTAPPKWMFRNITAIRENTDHIVDLLEGEGGRNAAELIRQSTP